MPAAARLCRDLDDLEGHPRHQAKPVEGEHQLFGSLTTVAIAVVAPVHSKAMPVILRIEEERESWMTAQALALQLRCVTMRS